MRRWQFWVIDGPALVLVWWIRALKLYLSVWILIVWTLIVLASVLALLGIRWGW